MPKKKRKNYDYYTLNIPTELRILYEAFILKNTNLGFKNVSQYLLHVLQSKAEEIIKEDPNLKRIERLDLPNFSYVLQEDGSYKKVIRDDKVAEKIDEMWEEEEV
jgi:hypothetical protein